MMHRKDNIHCEMPNLLDVSVYGMSIHNLVVINRRLLVHSTVVCKSLCFGVKLRIFKFVLFIIFVKVIYQVTRLSYLH